MSTVNSLIMNAVGDMVNGNIWAKSKPGRAECDAYITFNSAREEPEDFGDDEDHEWIYHMQVHYITKGQTDTDDIKRQLRSRLKAAGFIVTGIPVDEYVRSEEKPGEGLTHVVAECWISEDEL